MLQRLRTARKNESGFTLIELLIVIVILGILAAIVVFSVQGITGRGETSACKADKKTIEVAGEAFYAQNSTYAADMPALKAGGFIHDVPTATKYTITYALVGTPATGFIVGPATCP
jgi:prepilin-type N-terminal cleavage/methylation domain-containing protein